MKTSSGLRSTSGGVFTRKSYHTSSVPPPLDTTIVCPNCKVKLHKDRTYDLTHQQIIQYYKIMKVSSSVMPPLFVELMPDMRDDEYKTIKEDPAFLAKKAKVCDNCFIRLSDPKSALIADRRTSRVKTSDTLRVITSSNSPSRASSPSSQVSTPKSFGSTDSSISGTPRAKTPPRSRQNSTTSSASSKSGFKNFSSYSHNSTNNVRYNNSNQDNLHPETYYLHLYEEMDNLREEIKNLKQQLSESNSKLQQNQGQGQNLSLNQSLDPKTEISNTKNNKSNKSNTNLSENNNKWASNNSNGTDESPKRIAATDELRNHDNNNHVSSDDEALRKKDDQIVSLTSKIHELEDQESRYQDDMKIYENQIMGYKKEIEYLRHSMDQLKREQDEQQKRKEAVLAADRAHMLAEIDNMKKRFQAEKEQELRILRDKIIADSKRQIEKLVASLAEEKNGKEQAQKELRDLAKQFDLAKARLKVLELKEK